MLFGGETAALAAADFPERVILPSHLQLSLTNGGEAFMPSVLRGSS